MKPERLALLILPFRGERVLLDSDLAALYRVTTRALNQAVSRNRSRFPPDFKFRLDQREYERLRVMRSQTVIASRRNIRFLPYAFTEQGVAMLSSVLRSPRAVQVNIAIMRTFVLLRRLMDSNRDLARKILALEGKYDEQFATVFEAIRRLVAEGTPSASGPKRLIGFKTTMQAMIAREREG
jgi:hypothetical protein